MRCHGSFLPGSCTEEGEKVPEGLPWAGEGLPRQQRGHPQWEASLWGVLKAEGVGNSDRLLRALSQAGRC